MPQKRTKAAKIFANTSLGFCAFSWPKTTNPRPCDLGSLLYHNHTLPPGYNHLIFCAFRLRLDYGPLDGGKPKQITDFKDMLMTGFAFSHDGKQLACTRGTLMRDAILISDLK
jgi:hypothetical protein